MQGNWTPEPKKLILWVSTRNPRDWPNKKKVSIERDVYFDKNWALQPEKVSIEGVEDVFTYSDTS
jgi:hypothetical protein